jgi:hypothetical protein
MRRGLLVYSVLAMQLRYYFLVFFFGKRYEKLHFSPRRLALDMSSKKRIIIKNKTLLDMRLKKRIIIKNETLLITVSNDDFG